MYRDHDGENAFSVTYDILSKCVSPGTIDSFLS